VIPVLLPRVSTLPEHLIFLKEFRWISFSTKIDDEEVLDLLEWGITRKKPQRRLQFNDEKPGQVPTKELVLNISDSAAPKLEKFQFEIITLKTTSQRIEIKKLFLQKEYETKITIHTNRCSGQAEYFTENLGNGIGLEMISIPGGTFTMGSPKDEAGRLDRESPQHEVTLPPFFMGKYPATQAQWQAVASLPQINRELKPDPSNFKGVNRPVEQVSWYDAVEFCQRLSQHTGKPYRLSSEAEWEYACRAGTTTPFHFGETITSELANYNAQYTYGAGVKGKYREQTTEVGSFGVANAFGLYDMHGNVWEWCFDDWHENYEGATTDGSPWFNNNDNLYQKQGQAMLRGGSWFNYPDYCRSAYRDLYTRGSHFYHLGFRVVCAARRILR
jgi:formylglycine-generating enzyme required for sulfatase activity